MSEDRSDRPDDSDGDGTAEAPEPDLSTEARTDTGPNSASDDSPEDESTGSGGSDESLDQTSTNAEEPTDAAGGLAGLGPRRSVVLTLVVILLVAAGGIWVLGQPVDPESEIEPSQRNTAAYRSLQSAGISDAVVDITDERALVRYEVPTNMTRNGSMYYVMGVAARFGGNASSIVVQVYDDYEFVREAHVETAAVRAYLVGDISFAELRQQVEIRETQA